MTRVDSDDRVADALEDIGDRLRFLTGLTAGAISACASLAVLALLIR